MRKFIVVTMSLAMITISALGTIPYSYLSTQAETIKDYPDGDIISNPFTFPAETSSEYIEDFELDTNTSEETTVSTSSEESSPEISTSTQSEQELTSSEETTTENMETSTVEETATSQEETTSKDQEISTFNNESTTNEPLTSKEVETTSAEESTTINNSEIYVGKYYKDKKSGAIYKITSINKMTVTYMGSSRKAFKKAIIPAKVKLSGITFKVTAIGKNALKGRKDLTYVRVGKNVRTIGKNAFKNCSALKKVVIYSTVLKKVGSNTFKKTSKKLTIKIKNKKQLKKYKKLLKKKGQSKSASIK